MHEHRLSPEFRVAGRTLSGVAMRYGDVSPDFRERFVPGAFGAVSTIPVNLQHDSAIVVARDAILTDSARELRVRAELPEGSAALALVKRGALNGFSIEFRARAEHHEGGVRVVERATLTGLALVDRGAYPQSKAEVRARSGRTLRATIPTGRDLQCECIAQGGGGAACAAVVKFQEEIAEPIADMIGRAYEEAQAGVAGRDVLAVMKDYGSPVASARRGTLRARATGEGVALEADLPAGRVGDDVVAASETAGIIARPLIDYESPETVFTDTDTARVVERAHVRAILIGATDSRRGWDDAVIDYDGEARAAPAPARRRIWL